ncbi:MAG: hypothetical protein CMH62_03595 [Nanoarchaeota archaeon]|nr:hypothetical protein [Nanoarchaeota archaeon]|tara:strand:- start:1625 stop:1972 length:348 start_codon:yes stop_codon:yes gene_type:complete
MATEVWVINVLGIVFAIVAALLIIVKILPRIRDVADPIIGSETAINGLMSLLVLLVYILLFVGIIALIKNIDNQYLNFISVLDPGVNLFVSLLPYFKWLIFALVLGLSAKYMKKQ